ncbi:hypothetical protein J116_015330 [Streptomyces thermolilacinus SPC6]|uniref:Uncharacterized protein n=1 Tax=Streptomyces thermolilacinus SPC6 TaxID=1306406 RepID=A0A1D3DTJ4_9ACTN|nr:hypothetical protein J116_015330 [Streptomyces thermolilacinus SPC6]
MSELTSRARPAVEPGAPQAGGRYALNRQKTPTSRDDTTTTPRSMRSLVAPGPPRGFSRKKSARGSVRAAAALVWRQTPSGRWRASRVRASASSSSRHAPDLEPLVHQGHQQMRRRIGGHLVEDLPAPLLRGDGERVGGAAPGVRRDLTLVPPQRRPATRVRDGSGHDGEHVGAPVLVGARARGHEGVLVLVQAPRRRFPRVP